MEEILKAVFGTIFITFLPGFSLSYVFFPKKEVLIGVRILMSFVLTILFLPILVYLASLFGMRLNFLNILIIALIIIIGSCSYVVFKKRL